MTRMNALRETRVRGNVTVFTLGGEDVASSFGANCTAVEGRDATLVVDPLIAPAHARLVEAALASRGAPPVRFVVLTHHHTDHALGSSWFAGRGATVIAHEACPEGMAKEHPGLIAARRRDPALAGLFADAESVPPAVLFSDRVTIDLGGVEVRVIHPGHGHTRGDAIAHLPGESIAVCGDLVSNGYHVNFEDASPEGFPRGLESLLALDAGSYVPGHGAPGGREIVEEQKRYLDRVSACVGGGLASGRGEREIVDELRRNFPGYLLEMVLPETVRRFSAAL
jgi:cyclase